MIDLDEVIGLEKWIAINPDKHKIQLKRNLEEYEVNLRSSINEIQTPISFELFEKLLTLFDVGSIYFYNTYKNVSPDYKSYTMFTTEFSDALTVMIRKMIIDDIFNE